MRRLQVVFGMQTPSGTVALSCMYIHMYVCGGCVLPTSTTVSPTVLFAALSKLGEGISGGCKPHSLLIPCRTLPCVSQRTSVTLWTDGQEGRPQPEQGTNPCFSQSLRALFWNLKYLNVPFFFFYCCLCNIAITNNILITISIRTELPSASSYMKTFLPFVQTDIQKVAEMQIQKPWCEISFSCDLPLKA